MRVHFNGQHIPGLWFTPLVFVCLLAGISFFLNGGMVVNAVLYKAEPGKWKPHSNFHPSLVVYAGGVLGLHFLQGYVPPESREDFNNYCIFICACIILALFTHTVYNFVSILDDLAAFNKKPAEAKPVEPPKMEPLCLDGDGAF